MKKYLQNHLEKTAHILYDGGQGKLSIFPLLFTDRITRGVFCEQMSQKAQEFSYIYREMCYWSQSEQ